LEFGVHDGEQRMPNPEPPIRWGFERSIARRFAYRIVASRSACGPAQTLRRKDQPEESTSVKKDPQFPRNCDASISQSSAMATCALPANNPNGRLVPSAFWQKLLQQPSDLQLPISVDRCEWRAHENMAVTIGFDPVREPGKIPIHENFAPTT
jgi:hypothetical protein